MTHDKKARVDSQKQRVFQSWADAIEREVDNTEGDFIKPLYYVGYALNSQQRRKDHEKMDDSTNDLIRFVDAVLQTADWHDLKTRAPSMVTFTVCLLSEPDVASPAVSLFSRIFQSNYFSGGFNIAPCGASVNSVYMPTKTPNERETYWQTCRKYLHTNTDYLDYRKQEAELRRKLQRRAWDDEVTALQRDYDAGAKRRRKIVDDLNKVLPQMNQATMDSDDFFAEYKELWADTAKLSKRM